VAVGADRAEEAKQGFFAVSLLDANSIDDLKP
jgi:hypothetical protein